MTNRTRCEPDGVRWALGRLAEKKDVQAWSVLVAQVGPDVHRLAMRMTGDYALAEDIVQETFLLVRDCADRFIVRDGDGDDYARRWIMGVATNASLHIARRYRRELHRDARAGRAAAQTATPVIDPTQQAEDADENRLLRRELAELPIVYSQALTLHYFAGQEYAELASHLRVSVNTVRSRVHRGLKVLRERLDRCGVTLSIAALTGLLSHLGAASTVGGAATVSASTLGLISNTAVPTTSFVVGTASMTMATVLTSALAALLALAVLSGVWLSSFRAESTPPQIAAAVGAAVAVGAAEVVNKAQVTPFILVVKTDQMVVVKVPGADERKTTEVQLFGEKDGFFTSGPAQFRLPLHPFAHYDFTVDWGDSTTEVVRSDAAAGQAIVDEAWLAQVKNGLNQSVTFKTIDRFDPWGYAVESPYGHRNSTFFEITHGHGSGSYMISGIERQETKIERYLKYLLGMAGVDMCANIHVDPKIRENAGLQRVEALVSKLKFGAMKLSEVFDQLKTVTGLTYVLHDRALFITDRKERPLLVCPQHTYAKAGTYTVKITENIIGGFPQIYFNGGYDCVKVMDLAQWGSNTWASLDAAFMGCANMTIGASDAATAVTGAVKKFTHAWSGCSGLTRFPLLTTTAGMDFSSAWSGCSGLTSFPLLTTTAGTNFIKAWENCSGLTTFPLLNTAAGTSFGGAWSYCSRLTSFPLLNTAAGTNFDGAWCSCSGLTSFPLLNTAAGTDFNVAWGGCSGLTSFPLLNTSAGTNFSAAWYDCRGLTIFPLLNTSAGTNFSAAWNGCSGLTGFPLLDTSSGTNFVSAWRECSGLTGFPLLDTSAGTDFSGTWRDCSGMTIFPLLNTAAGKIFGAGLGGAWENCTGLTIFPLLDTSAGTIFSSAWSGCRGLTIFPLLKTSAGTDFRGAWSGQGFRITFTCKFHKCHPGSFPGISPTTRLSFV